MTTPADKDRSMRFCYADPPYLGCCGLYEHEHGEGGCWDYVETHRALIDMLSVVFKDGWALSASSVSLRTLLPLCPADVRVAAWVKPFCAFKKGVRPCYAWEPIIFRGGRNPANGYAHPPPVKGGKQTTPKDFVWERAEEQMQLAPAIAESITLRKGLTGAKPEKVCQWILDLLGYRDGDEMVDLYPGTGVMTKVAA